MTWTERQGQVITGRTLFSRHLGTTEADCMPMWAKQCPGWQHTSLTNLFKFF